MQECIETKNSVNGIIEEYIWYVTMCLSNEDYIKAINGLLPFDKFVQIKLKNAYDESLVKSMGLSIMRMDFKPSLFSLGISLEIEKGMYNQAVDTVVFISACKTLKELREHVRTENFARQVKEYFERLVEQSFSYKAMNA